MDMSFNTQNSVDTWRVINDGVMGGRSSGGPRFENGVMVFEGRINTNGGGFSSIRLDVEAGLLAQADALSLCALSRAAYILSSACPSNGSGAMERCARATGRATGIFIWQGHRGRAI